MTRRIPAAFAFICITGLIITAALETDGTAQVAGKKGYKLVAPLDVLMDTVDTMFLEIDEKLVPEKKYRTVRKRAYVLAELFNVAGHFSEVDPPEKRKDWDKYAASNRDDFLKLADVSKSKDPKQVKALWQKINETCESCHDIFQ